MVFITTEDNKLITTEAGILLVFEGDKGIARARFTALPITEEFAASSISEEFTVLPITEKFESIT